MNHTKAAFDFGEKLDELAPVSLGIWIEQIDVFAVVEFGVRPIRVLDAGGDGVPTSPPQRGGEIEKIVVAVMKEEDAAAARPDCQGRSGTAEPVLRKRVLGILQGHNEVVEMFRAQHRDSTKP